MNASLVNLTTNVAIQVDRSSHEETPLVIGRGAVSGCDDKRVSRKHLNIFWRGGLLVMKALHTNPCFYMKSGLPPVTQVKKGEEMIMKSGDYFALLPDSMWYEVKTKEEEIDICKTELKLSVEDSNPGTSKVSSDESTDNLGPHHPGISEELKKTRRLPLWMYESNTTQSSTQQKAKTPQKRASSPEKDSPSKKLKVSVESPAKLNVDRENMETADSSFSLLDRTEIKEDVEDFPTASAIVEPSVNEQLIVQVSEDNVVTQVKEEKDEVKTEVKPEIKPEPNEEVEKKTNSDSEKVTKPPNNDKPTSSNEKDGYESDVAEPPDTGAAAAAGGGGNDSPPQPAQRRRPVCQYEERCYRKNPQHKSDYCHPGDPDYLRMADRPVCQYGASCYRQNVLHRVEFQHPPGTPAPRPSPPPQSNSTTPPASPLQPRKRKANYRQESDEDDYDLDDPFINDASSDDFVPSDLSSEEDNVTDLSQEDSENLRKLKKEAKKLLKKKKKKTE